MSGFAVMGVQREQEVVEHIQHLQCCALELRRCVTAIPNCLGSVCESSINGTQAQGAKFANQFHGGDRVEC